MASILRNKRLRILLCCLLFSLTPSTAPLAAPAFSPGQKVVVNAQETPAYEAIPRAREADAPLATLQRPAEPETRRDVNDFYVVLEEKDGWLHIEEYKDSSFWVKAKDMIDLDAFLADPANAEIVVCPDSLPRRFTVDLDASRKNAVLRMVTAPTLSGGQGQLQVWDSDEKNMLWTTAGTVDAAGDAFAFDCYRLGVTWPEIVGDVNADGNADIVFLSTPIFRGPPWKLTVFSWNGKAFVLAADGFMVTFSETMPASIPADTGPYTSESENARRRIYLDRLLELTPDGAVKAEFVQDANRDNESGDKRGIGAFRLSRDNTAFLFEGWIEPLQEAKSE